MSLQDDYDVQHAVEKILKMDKVPEDSSPEYEILIENLGVPKWADVFRQVLKAIQTRRSILRQNQRDLQQERIEKKLDKIKSNLE